MNAYKNSIREYGWLSLCSFRPTEEKTGRMRPGEGSGEGKGGEEGCFPILDLRLEYLIGGVLLAHVYTSNRRRITAMHSARHSVRQRCRAFVLSFSFFRTFAVHRIFQSARCDRLVVISGEIEKDGT